MTGYIARTRAPNKSSTLDSQRPMRPEVIKPQPTRYDSCSRAGALCTPVCHHPPLRWIHGAGGTRAPRTGYCIRLRGWLHASFRGCSIASTEACVTRLQVVLGGGGVSGGQDQGEGGRTLKHKKTNAQNSLHNPNCSRSGFTTAVCWHHHTSLR